MIPDNISITFGNLVTKDTQANIEPSSRTFSSAVDAARNSAVFSSIIQTWAGYVPESYTEVEFANDDAVFKYAFTIVHDTDSCQITISWANDWSSTCCPGILVNSTYFDDLAEALEYFNDLLMTKEDI